MVSRHLPPGRYRCPKCGREVVLIVASRALCVHCYRVMRLVSTPQRDLETPCRAS